MIPLDQEYQKYQGQAVLAPGGGAGNNGQCEQWFDLVLHDVYGQPYFYSQAAYQIWTNPGVLTNNFDRIPYSPSMVIQKGDFVIYSQNIGEGNGHVDVAAQNGIGSNYVGYDSNWGGKKNSAGYPILWEVTHNDSYNQFIYGVLRFKETIMEKLDPNQLPLLLLLCWGNQPVTQADKDKINSLADWQTQLNTILGDNRCNLWVTTEQEWIKGNGPALNKDTVIQYIQANLS